MTDEKKPAATKPSAAVTLLGRRTREVPLEYPAVLEGETYDKVTIRRMSAVEVGEFIEQARSGATIPYSMLDIPEELFVSLDDDDRETIEEAIFDFLPRRLQTALLLNQEAGEDTSPPSQASSGAESSNTSA